MARLEPKTATEVRDYRFDWTEFLGDDDSILSYVVSATGVAIDSDSDDGEGVTVWVSGGTNGAVARITNTITTTGGLTETQVFTLPILNADEPVSLQELKDQCRVGSDTSEDNLILSLGRAARAYVETYTGHILLRRRFTDQFDRFGDYLQIMKRPVITIDDVTYTGTDGSPATFSDHVGLLDRFPARVYPETNWPSLGSNGTILVGYTAGYGQGEEPEDLLHAIRILTAAWFAGRDTAEIPPAVISLCDQHRLVSV